MELAPRLQCLSVLGVASNAVRVVFLLMCMGRPDVARGKPAGSMVTPI
jgi:hypothetical protein